MQYFKASKHDEAHRALMRQYDSLIRSRIGNAYRWPIRMREWELACVLRALPTGVANGRVLETGSHNTFLGLWLSQSFTEVVVSDLLWQRFRTNLLQRLRVYRYKETEAPFLRWYRTLRKAAFNPIHIKSVDLTRIPYPDDYFDCITSISVIEHIPDVSVALSEMYRCLRPGGMMLITTDCSPEPTSYANGVRYFSPTELEALLQPYPVSSPVDAPDFAPENRCYDPQNPVVNAFFEIRKPGARAPFQ